MVNAYFESSASYWKQIYSDDGLLPTIYQERHNTALRWVKKLGLRANARILEAGCGAGLITIALARRGYKVDAIDAAKSMIQIARQDVLARGVQDRVRLHLADVHALPFNAETFDLVGWSFGGFVSMQLASLDPARIRRMVLIDVCGRPDVTAVGPVWARLRLRVTN